MRGCFQLQDPAVCEGYRRAVARRHSLQCILHGISACDKSSYTGDYVYVDEKEVRTSYILELVNDFLKPTRHQYPERYFGSLNSALRSSYECLLRSAYISLDESCSERTPKCLSVLIHADIRITIQQALRGVILALPEILGQQFSINPRLDQSSLGGHAGCNYCPAAAARTIRQIAPTPETAGNVTPTRTRVRQVPHQSELVDQINRIIVDVRIAIETLGINRFHTAAVRIRTCPPGTKRIVLAPQRMRHVRRFVALHARILLPRSISNGVTRSGRTQTNRDEILAKWQIIVSGNDCARSTGSYAW